MKSRDMLILGGLAALFLLKPSQAAAYHDEMPYISGSFSQEVAASIPANINQDTLSNIAIQLSGNPRDTSKGTLYMQSRGSYNVSLGGAETFYFLPQFQLNQYRYKMDGSAWYAQPKYALEQHDIQTGKADITGYATYADLPERLKQYA